MVDFSSLFISRDLSSGYLVAEMFSHYYPQDFPMHSYDKGASLSTKQRNWSQIQRVRGGSKYDEHRRNVSVQSACDLNVVNTIYFLLFKYRLLNSFLKIIHFSCPL